MNTAARTTGAADTGVSDSAVAAITPAPAAIHPQLGQRINQLVRPVVIATTDVSGGIAGD